MSWPSPKVFFFAQADDCMFNNALLEVLAIIAGLTTLGAPDE